MDLHIVWFGLLILLFIGYIVLDGFDLGVGMLHLSAKTDRERRVFINSIGPVWDANEVWLITAGGALFAAFPDVYATVFSGFYTAFMLFLLVLIARAISIEFRGKADSEKWKKVWDITFNVSSYLIVLLLGITFGNLVSGMPISADKEYMGTFLQLLNPYSIYVGFTAVLLLRLHGRLYLIIKTDGDLAEQLKSKFFYSWSMFFILYIGLIIWTFIDKPFLFENYNHNGALYLIPVLIILSIILILLMVNSRKYFTAFIFSSIVIAFSILQSGISMFPNLVISNPNPEFSLTIFNASSSDDTLFTMFIIACIGVPLVLIYKFIMFTAFRGKVKIDSNSY